MAKSIEPKVQQHFESQMLEYKLEHTLQQESLNDEIASALSNAPSKSGGDGGNRPDAQIMIQLPQSLKYIPVIVEHKGTKNKLEKLDIDGFVDNSKQTNIQNFAVNGAVYYSEQIMFDTSYKDVIAIGTNGYETSTETKYELEAYYVSTQNHGIAKKIGSFDDFSFLKKENLKSLEKKINEIFLTEDEIRQLHKKQEQDIEDSLAELNEYMYNENGISPLARIHIISATIMATLGVPGKVVPLTADKLNSVMIDGEETDAEIIIRKVTAFLKNKNIPEEKRETIVNTLFETLKIIRLNKPENGGQSILKKMFIQVNNLLGHFYKSGINADFASKMFNVMYNWVPIPDGGKNDVVLTPTYISELLVKLARVNMNSYTFDLAAGSGGLLVAAMNEMIHDARKRIKSPEQLEAKIQHIKERQLLGVEILPEVYMLAVLNMILMGDGSSNLLNEDSLNEYNGEYGYDNSHIKYPGDAFVLNPPYSAEGNGMIFVKTALNMMNTGYAAIIIQNSAGNGKAKDINVDILKNHTLIASIKMPVDVLPIQTYIYVFEVGKAHNAKSIVKFIDFSNDGYKRFNRKKAKASSNLRNVDHAKERYQEVADIVNFGPSYINLIGEENYYENTIDPNNGADWNQNKPVDITPRQEDFEKTVSDFLAYEISQILRGE
ncbi:N-6 DNA methylase [Bacillus cereus group sp. WSBC 10925]|uniref:site-specific DNA-methyltransferase (adenine-specific) n=1 Tax=Bacillus paranthracis TaxID=2026186 RepID=A0A7D8D2M3_9BACI|nr:MULTISPECIES: N-6 DNA methylase [Bacillus]EJR04981.1 hypothetical protein II7_05486 [Bacillus cereus MSX-A12]KXI65857.1 restriction endonuclease subunit M [Bacillus cereus]MCC2408310.1 SAM-dependent methyltransferase [Bacillus paranthracis]MCC2520078.1 SAM-dependent methyltransferase [Bacillus paranthracis]MCT6514694.1 SAM-dependent methyltransferase [Bacillus subtilis]